MDTPLSPTSRTAAWVATAALFLASAVGVATIDRDDDVADVATSNDTTTTTTGGISLTPGPSDTPGVPGATTGSTSAPASTPTTRRTAGPGGTTPTTADASLGAAQDPGATVPPKAGTYRQRVTMQGEAKESTLKVVDVSRSGNTTTQRISFESDQGPIDNDVIWQPNALVVTKSRFTFGSSTAECDWEPDMQEYAFPLARGTTFSVDSRCTITVQGAVVNVRRTATSKIVELQRVKVAGTVVDTWVIDQTEKVETSGGFASTSESTGKEWFSPKHGLGVRSSARGTSTNPFGKQDVTVETELLDLAPR